MDYVIENESLVYYALRDPVSGKYLHNTLMQGPLGVDLPQADTRDTITEITLLRNKLINEDPKLKDLQIRKVKIIDIGEVL